VDGHAREDLAPLRHLDHARAHDGVRRRAREIASGETDRATGRVNDPRDRP